MIKKLSNLLFAGALLSLASCSNEDLVNPGQAMNPDGTVSFSIELPEVLQSRAMSDGLSATTLCYSVYEVMTDDSKEYRFCSEIPGQFNGSTHQTTVNIPLVKGKDYVVSFFAKSPDAPYAINDADGNIEIDYSSAPVANNDKYDAFYGLANKITAGTDVPSTVQLYRPFAQVNIGASDWDEAKIAGMEVTKGGLKFSASVYNQLNMLTGTATGEQSNLEFTLENFPDATPGNPEVLKQVVGEDYYWMATSYVLVSSDDSTVPEVTFNYDGISSNNSASISSVPVKRNYRTNILGKFFTEGVSYTIEIEPVFSTPDLISGSFVTYDGVDYLIDTTPWDGSTAEPLVTHTDGTVVICSAAQFYQLAQIVNGNATRGANQFDSEKVVLLCDIDLNNKLWTPIGLNADDSKKFKGTLDGQGHVISNLKINRPAAYEAAGLFGALNGTVKNLVIKNADINAISGSQDNTDNGIAVVAGSIYSSGNIENVKVYNATLSGNRYMGGIAGYTYGSVKNCEVDGLTIVCHPDNYSGKYDNGDKCGGLLGYFIDESVYEVSGNTVKNFSITAYRDLGGLIGCADNLNGAIKNNNVENGTLIVDQSVNNYGNKTTNAGEIIGRNMKSYDLVANNNTSLNVNVLYNVASQAEFAAILPNISAKDVTIKLGAGLFQFAGGTTSPIAVTEAEIKGGHEAQDAIRFANMHEGMNITIEGQGNNTCLIMSDGSGGVPGGSVSVLVNKANINFKNMMQVRRYHGLLDAKVETYENCLIYGNVQARSETVKFKDCQFTTRALSHNISGLGSLPDTNYAIFYGGYFRNLVFDDCTFTAYQPKAIQIYATHRWNVRQDITATNCILNDGAHVTDAKSRAFFEVHGELGVHGTINLTNCKINQSDAANWNGGLWTNHFSSSGDNFTVIVDGTTKVTSNWSGAWENVWDGVYF